MDLPSIHTSTTVSPFSSCSSIRILISLGTSCSCFNIHSMLPIFTEYLPSDDSIRKVVYLSFLENDLLLIANLTKLCYITYETFLVK